MGYDGDIIGCFLGCLKHSKNGKGGDFLAGDIGDIPWDTTGI